MSSRFSEQQKKEIQKLASEVVEKQKDKFVRLKPTTIKDLKRIGLFGETYNDVAKVLIEVYEDFASLLNAVARSESDSKTTASRLSQKYAQRIKQLER